MAELKSAREWWETTAAADALDWDSLPAGMTEKATRLIAGVREEAGKAIVDAYKAACGKSGCVPNAVVIAGMITALDPPPDPRLEARGRKLYELMNPDGTPWERHGEEFHKRYRGIAEAMREDGDG